MTIVGHRWGIAESKARFSELLEKADATPQIIENRGRPVAVVLSFDAYRESVGDPEDVSVARAKWRTFLETSAQIRTRGGAKLATLKRGTRRDPFAHDLLSR